MNVSFVTGLGWKRQHEVVNQYAQNDRRILPPSGIPVGSIRESADNTLQLYGSELSSLVFPTENADTAPFPFYDRWSDIHNVYTEFVVLNQARSLATAAFLAGRTSYTNQTWSAGPLQDQEPQRKRTPESPSLAPWAEPSPTLQAQRLSGKHAMRSQPTAVTSHSSRRTTARNGSKLKSNGPMAAEFLVHRTFS